MAYSKHEAIRIITKAAEAYAKKLLNKNFLVIYKDRESGKIEYFETLFLARNFQHLTGVEYIRSRKDASSGSVDFFNKCRRHQLKESEIKFKCDGTTQLKLKVLPKIIDFYNSSNMTTTVDVYRPLLNVDRLAGNIFYCLGFVKSEKYYYPASCLMGDIRDYGSRPSQILGILGKQTTDEKYNELHYKAKDVEFNELILQESFQNLIDT